MKLCDQSWCKVCPQIPLTGKFWPNWILSCRPPAIDLENIPELLCLFKSSPSYGLTSSYVAHFIFILFSLFNQPHYLLTSQRLLIFKKTLDLEQDWNLSVLLTFSWSRWLSIVILTVDLLSNEKSGSWDFTFCQFWKGSIHFHICEAQISPKGDRSNHTTPVCFRINPISWNYKR